MHAQENLQTYYKVTKKSTISHEDQWFYPQAIKKTASNFLKGN